jgi:hypothetical protein
VHWECGRSGYSVVTRAVFYALVRITVDVRL